MDLDRPDAGRAVPEKVSGFLITQSWDLLTIECMVVRSTLPVGQTFIWHRLALPTRVKSYPRSGSSSPAPEELVKLEDASSAMKVETSSSFVTSQVKLEMSETTWNGPTTATATTTTVTSTSSMVKIEEHPQAELDTAIPIMPELPLDVSSSSDAVFHTSQADSKVEDRPDFISAVPPAQRNPEEQEPVFTKAHDQEIDDLEEDEPLEEYSRASPNPDRVVLLRQTKTKIWIASVLPNSAVERGNEIDGIIEGKAEREERDKAWFADYFQLPTLSPGVSSSISVGCPGDRHTELAGENQQRPPPLPLLLMEQYAHWKALDPLLFGKAYDRDELPKGVRVVRQEGWECLVS
jgi:hypothetical protein